MLYGGCLVHCTSIKGLQRRAVNSNRAVNGHGWCSRAGVAAS